eukprot:283337-Chlamydomonas_euryale.AAC.1
MAAVYLTSFSLIQLAGPLAVGYGHTEGRRCEWAARDAERHLLPGAGGGQPRGGGGHLVWGRQMHIAPQLDLYFLAACTRTAALEVQTCICRSNAVLTLHPARCITQQPQAVHTTLQQTLVIHTCCSFEVGQTSSCHR